MEYTVIMADDVPALIKKVNEAINEGWEPLGGMTVNFRHAWENQSNYYFETYVSQAMIKR